MDADAPVLLFDGHCNVCNRAVDFVLSHEDSPALRFASLQSEAGRGLLARNGVTLPEGDPDTMILVEGDRVWTLSDAALRIAKRLRLPWRMGGWFLWLPRVLRDGAYRWFARNRYRWFGRSDTCRLATPEERARFL